MKTALLEQTRKKLFISGGLDLTYPVCIENISSSHKTCRQVVFGIGFFPSVPALIIVTPFILLRDWFIIQINAVVIEFDR